MTEHLKPCPFCGGEADLVRIPVGAHPKCNDCGAELMAGDIGVGWYGSDDEAIAAWNRRTEQTAMVSDASCVIEVIGGVEGASLYIGDGEIGHRLAGSKPWGGGRTLHKFKVNIDELIKEAAALAKGEVAE